ncbi:flagellar biosynthetic protein FliR [mine drainage metagenome]|uniref:Flagellar biosynthetic protein FliR n=1 Tax=mine drainage metagenome TaxID=410659 RepID=A0A1J5PVJ2_9ZZZZ
MIHFTSTQVEAWIGAFFWPFVRILAMLSVAPAFGMGSVPVMLRVGLAVLVSVALAPALPAMPPVQFGTATAWMLVLQQMLVGGAIGLAMTLILSAVQLAGGVIGLQMGMGFATLFDPVQGVQVTSLASFLNMLTLLLFLALNGHLVLLAVLARSFTLLPVAPNLGLTAQSWHTLALSGGAIFSLGLALAAPVLGVLLIANLGLGVLTKLAPQLNLFAIGFPLFFMLGFLALYLVMPAMQNVVQHLVDVGLDLSGQLLQQAAAR